MDGFGRGFADEVALVLVVVSTVAFVWRDAEFGCVAGASMLFVQELFHRPAETSGVLGVDGFKDQQDRAHFEEDDRPDESRDAAAVEDLVVEFCRWSHHG